MREKKRAIDDGWRLPDELWERMEALLPPQPPQPKGGRPWTPDRKAMDGAMTKAPVGGEATGPHLTDRAKLGTKRSLLTDGKGVVLGMAVEGANRHDMKLVEATLSLWWYRGQQIRSRTYAWTRPMTTLR